MSDRDQILEALAEFAAATDQRDWTAIRNLLAPDAHAYSRQGHDKIIGVMQAHLGGVGPTQHLLGNHRVEITGDRARSRTYARVHHVGAGPLEGSFFECLGDYTDDWLRMAEGWRLTNRVFEMRIQLGDIAVLRPA